MSKVLTVLVIKGMRPMDASLRRTMEKRGHRFQVVPDAPSAVIASQRRLPDLVVVIADGLSHRRFSETILYLRSSAVTGSVRIAVLGRECESTEELVAFALGADDYINAMRSPEVVLARIEAVARRGRQARVPDGILTAGPIQVNVARRSVTVDGTAVTLTPTELRLCSEIMAARGNVVTRERLMSSVFDSQTDPRDRRIDAHMSALRRKLGRGAQYIRTVRGVGFASRTSNRRHVDRRLTEGYAGR